MAAAYQYFPDTDSSSSDEDYSPTEDWKKVNLEVCCFYSRLLDNFYSWKVPKNEKVVNNLIDLETTEKIIKTQIGRKLSKLKSRAVPLRRGVQRSKSLIPATKLH